MIKRLMWLSVLLGVSGYFWAPPAHAISITFQPSPQTVSVGASFDVNLVIAGLEAGSLDEIVSAFDGLLHSMSLLPLPPGEGRGEGPYPELGGPLSRAAPPNPLPGGEGKEDARQ